MSKSWSSSCELDDDFAAEARECAELLAKEIEGERSRYLRDYERSEAEGWYYSDHD